MSPDELVVVAAGIAAIVGVNVYFFGGGGTRAVVAAGAAGIPEATIVVRGGYEPKEVRVPAGRPARLVFDRRETSGCSEEVVIPDASIRRYLPANERTAVEVRFDEPGTYEFTCGMGMLRGRIVVEEVDR